MTKEKQIMERNQMKQTFHYNKTAKGLPILHEGDTVRMKPFQLGEKTWGKAIVNKRLDERSYEVETNSGTYRRNTVHLRKSNEKPPDIHQRPDQPSDDRTARRDDRMARRDDRTARRGDRTTRRNDPTSREEVNESEAMNEPTSPARVSQRNDEPEMENIRTRSGRAVKAPERFNDYVSR